MNPKIPQKRPNRILFIFIFFQFAFAYAHIHTDRSKTNKIVTSQNLYLIKSVSFYSFQYQQCTL